MNQKVLINGATGNVEIALIKALQNQAFTLTVYAGVRELQADANRIAIYPVITVGFDFLDFESVGAAFRNCDILFLLRLPQLADVDSIFRPTIRLAKEAGIQHIVFLSVQGVEKNAVIPHHKIEKLILDSEIPYTFLRPAYFMQNFTTTLQADLVKRDEIFLPAGKAKFTLVDVEDIGEVAARVIQNTESYENQALELTTNQALSFGEMAICFTEILGRKIKYISPNLITFFLRKRKEGMATPFILVMIMLHFLPRFQNTPKTTATIAEILRRAPITFAEFIQKNKSSFTR
jgi:uncharacterized protein YbjT (DUF2867 family)